MVKINQTTTHHNVHKHNELSNDLGHELKRTIFEPITNDLDLEPPMIKIQVTIVYEQIANGKGGMCSNYMILHVLAGLSDSFHFIF